MPVNPSDFGEAVAAKAHQIWWLVSSPWIWGLVGLSFWRAVSYERFMDRKDLEEWKKRNEKRE